MPHQPSTFDNHGHMATQSLISTLSSQIMTQMQTMNMNTINTMHSMMTSNIAQHTQRQTHVQHPAHSTVNPPVLYSQPQYQMQYQYQAPNAAPIPVPVATMPPQTVHVPVVSMPPTVAPLPFQAEPNHVPNVQMQVQTTPMPPTLVQSHSPTNYSQSPMNHTTMASAAPTGPATVPMMSASVYSNGLPCDVSLPPPPPSPYSHIPPMHQPTVPTVNHFPAPNKPGNHRLTTPQQTHMAHPQYVSSTTSQPRVPNNSINTVTYGPPQDKGIAHSGSWPQRNNNHHIVPAQSGTWSQRMHETNSSCNPHSISTQPTHRATESSYQHQYQQSGYTAGSVYNVYNKSKNYQRVIQGSRA
jgi:hypothetical protein